MIKFNETYTINNGQESIVFKEGKANTITGEYMDGTLTGTLEGNSLKATFHNKKTNGAGLIEFTFTENGFSAKWKQGLEAGPMRGKWIAILESANNLADNGNDNPIREYLIQHSGIDFSLFDYKTFVNDFLGNFDLENNQDDQYKVEQLYDELLSLYAENPSLYGGAVYLFQEIVKNVSDGNVWLDFDYEEIQSNAYSLDRLLDEGTPVKLVCEEYPVDIFKNVFLTKMIFTLLTVVEEIDDAELLAELIVASNINQFTNPETEDSSYGDWVSDMVIDILDILGFPLDNYEGESTIEGGNFMDMGMEMGYDYIQLAEDFRDKYC
jgi:hypothetical protein